MQSIARIHAVCIEDYGPINRTSGKIAQRAEMVGIIKHYVLRVLQVPLITVPPTSLKQFATGNGSSKKEAMLNEANKLGYFPNTNDEADAFFCAKLAERVITGGQIGIDFTRTNP